MSISEDDKPIKSGDSFGCLRCGATVPTVAALEAHKVAGCAVWAEWKRRFDEGVAATDWDKISDHESVHDLHIGCELGFKACADGCAFVGRNIGIPGFAARGHNLRPECAHCKDPSWPHQPGPGANYATRR